MVHLRIVAPHESARRALELLEASPSVTSVVVFAEAARKPKGDVIECVVAREEASVLIDDLRELEIPAAANVAVGGALGAEGEGAGALAQLGVNLTAIVRAGVLTLYLQRRVYLSRRLRHLREPARRRAALPVGHSRRSERDPQPPAR